MSAREDLLDVFDAGGCNDPRFTFEEVADRILNAHAHELAEQIRVEADKPRRSDESRMGQRLRRTRYRSAADLIDPHASAVPVRPDEEPTT